MILNATTYRAGGGPEKASEAPLRLQDSFTGQTRWQGSRKGVGNPAWLTRLVHRPGKLAGVFDSLDSRGRRQSVSPPDELAGVFDLPDPQASTPPGGGPFPHSVKFFPQFSAPCPKEMSVAGHSKPALARRPPCEFVPPLKGPET